MPARPRYRLWQPEPALGDAPDASPFVQLEPRCRSEAGRLAVARAIAASIDILGAAAACPRPACRRARECRADPRAAGPAQYCRAPVPADLLAAMALAGLVIAGR